MGVTIWRCHGIAFDYNIFRNMLNYGIHGWDYGVAINGANVFENNRRGVDIYSTMPVFGKTVTAGGAEYPFNTFRDNMFGIYANGTDELHGLFVRNNRFFDYQNAGVYIEGEARFRIEGQNSFRAPGALYSVRCGDTGDGPLNLIQCNIFGDIRNTHVLSGRDNSGLLALNNDFNHVPFFADVMVSGNSGSPGRIDPYQGGEGFPANNCFSTPAKAFFTSISEPFDYYVDPDLQQEFPDCENVPVENGNFELIDTDNETSADDCNLNGPEVPEPPFTEEDLEEKRQHLANAYEAWQADPEDQSLAYAHRQAEREKDVVLFWLLKEAIDHQNYAEADELLIEEADNEAQRWRFSVKLMAKDFAGANAVLSHLPQGSEDDIHFADVMAVNLQLWQEEAAFQLSAAQENRLSEIAYSQSPSRAYARSLLNLLTGADFEPDEEEWGEPEQSRPAPTATTKEKRYAVFPNPASGEVLLSYPASDEELQLQVIHLPTSRQKTFALDGSGRFAWRTSGFSSGVYLLRFVKNGEVLHQEKAVVVK